MAPVLKIQIGVSFENTKWRLINPNTKARFLVTCRYLSWRAAEDSAITSEASRSARDAFCSPSAAMT